MQSHLTAIPHFLRYGIYNVVVGFIGLPYGLLVALPSHQRRRHAEILDPPENPGERVRGTTTAVIRDGTYLECQTAFAPILIDFSRSVVNDLGFTDIYLAQRGREASTSESIVRRMYWL